LRAGTALLLTVQYRCLFTGKKTPSVKKDTGGTTRRELTYLLLTDMLLVCERWGVFRIEMIGFDRAIAIARHCTFFFPFD
jgi:hypothetical protein